MFLNQMDTRPYRVFLLDGADTRLELDSLSYTAGCVGSGFSLGNACAAEFTAKAAAQGLPYDQGARVTLWAELLAEGAGPEPVPMGSFILSKIQ